ncbi:15202_t:CDS:2, partial [Cetraspora pellucida]
MKYISIDEIVAIENDKNINRINTTNNAINSKINFYSNNKTNLYYVADNSKTNLYYVVDNSETNMYNAIYNIYHAVDNSETNLCNIVENSKINMYNTMYNIVNNSETNLYNIEYNVMDNNKTSLYNVRHNVMCNSKASAYNVVNDNNVDVEDYFEEAYHGSVDIEDTNMNADAIIIKEEDSFFDFNNAVQHIRCYAEFKEFKIRLGRSTMIDTEHGKRHHNDALNELKCFGQQFTDDMQANYSDEFFKLSQLSSNIIDQDIIKSYLDNMHKHEKELAQICTNNENNDSNKENIDSNIQLRNPLVITR